MGVVLIVLGIAIQIISISVLGWFVGSCFCIDNVNWGFIGQVVIFQIFLVH